MSALLILSLRLNPDMFEHVNPLLETSQTVNLGILPWVVNRPVKQKTMTFRELAVSPPYGGRLHHAVKLNPLNRDAQLQRLRELLCAGANTRMLDNRGDTVLMRAMRIDHRQPDYVTVQRRVETLLEFDPDLARFGTRWVSTPLHYALRTGDGVCMGEEVLAALLAVLDPQDIHIKDNWSRLSAFEMVKNNAFRWPELMRLFEQHAARA